MVRKFFKYLLYAWLISLIPVIAYKWINPPYTLIQFSQRDLRGESGDWLNLEEIPDHFEKAAIAGEDQRFFEHSGLDLKAIEKAIEHNQKSKKKHGASTISQQTAKNVFCWEGRSWLRKGIETYYTIWIELIWGKERILEVYLNVIEMGRGAFGIDEAASYYYKKPVNDLSKNQCVNIASMFPCPRTCGINHPISRRRQYLINKSIRRYGIILEYKNKEN